MTDKPKGLKLDAGKLAYHLQNDAAEAEMVAVLTFGAVKYDPGNWEHVEEAEDRYYDAARRHLRASRRGEILDPETHLFTLAHAACCIHFLLALELKRNNATANALSERLEHALGVARKIRAEREAAAASTRVDAASSYEWTVKSDKGRRVKNGFASTLTAARAAAEDFIASRRGKRGKFEIRRV